MLFNANLLNCLARANSKEWRRFRDHRQRRNVNVMKKSSRKVMNAMKPYHSVIILYPNINFVLSDWWLNRIMTWLILLCEYRAESYFQRYVGGSTHNACPISTNWEGLKWHVISKFSACGISLIRFMCANSCETWFWWRRGEISEINSNLTRKIGWLCFEYEPREIFLVDKTLFLEKKKRIVANGYVCNWGGSEWSLVPIFLLLALNWIW